MTWRSTSLRAVAEVALGRQRAPQHATGPNMVAYLRAANVKDGTLSLDDVLEMNFTPSEQVIFGLRPGDVLMTEGSGSRSVVGSSAVWRGEIAGTVCFQNTLLRLRPRSGIVDPHYLAWWAQAARASGQLASIAGGANIYHLSADRVRQLPMMLPSLEEQRRIAGFLNAQTSKIDALKQARSDQFRLLEDRQLSQIFSAVRGVEEPGTRRASGLDWLGDVPTSWPVLSVSSQFEVLLGKMLNPDRTRGEYLRPYLRNTNVQWDVITTEDLLLMDFPPHERARYEVRPGDLLICEGGQPGRSAIWAGGIEEIYYQKALHRARSRGRTSPRWLFYCLRAAVAQDVFSVEGNTTTIGHLTGEQLRAHRFAFPDRGVQDRLVDGLDQAGEVSQVIRRSLKRQTELLNERRQALITAAVTGQIDVTTARGVG